MVRCGVENNLSDPLGSQVLSGRPRANSRLISACIPICSLRNSEISEEQHSGIT